MKPATTTVVVRRYLCLRRTRVSAHPHAIAARLQQVARPVVEQANMAETEQQEVIAQK